MTLRQTALNALHRPEMGAFFAMIFVLILFLSLAGHSGMFSALGVLNWLEVAAQLGLLATGVALLMIAGEFDLSIGSMIGFSGILLALFLTYFHLSVPVALLLTFLASLGLGALNGYLIVTTGLPSFIVSLSFLFILRGLSIAIPRLLTEQTLIGDLHSITHASTLAQWFGGNLGYPVMKFFAEQHWIAQLPNGEPVISGIPMILIWWLVLVLVCHYILLHTQWGNWIFACGGDKQTAEKLGVPAKKVKLCLFIFTAFCACLYACCQVLNFGSADSQRGILKEFETIIAVVIGGGLMTGGYGSVVGAAFGAIIFAVIQMGFFYTGVETDWFRVFLGATLLMAVIMNTVVRQRITKGQAVT